MFHFLIYLKECLGAGGSPLLPSFTGKADGLHSVQEKGYSSRNRACHVAGCADFVWPRLFNLDLLREHQLSFNLDVYDSFLPYLILCPHGVILLFFQANQHLWKLLKIRLGFLEEWPLLCVRQQESPSLESHGWRRGRKSVLSGLR